MGLRWLHTSIFIEASSLEGLATRLKRIPRPMRWDYPLLDINPAFPGLRVIIIIFGVIIIIIIIIIIKHGWNKNNHVSIQHINLYELSEITTSIIKYTSILILTFLQELINNLLNFQTTYRIATNRSYQSSITDIVKLKWKQFLGVTILIKRMSISFNK